MTTRATDLPSLAPAGADAALKAFGIMSKGVQTLTDELVAYNKKSFERSASLLQDLAGARNVGEAIEIQTSYWKTAYEGYAAELTRLGEIWAGVAREAGDLGRKSAAS